MADRNKADNIWLRLAMAAMQGRGMQLSAMDVQQIDQARNLWVRVTAQLTAPCYNNFGARAPQDVPVVPQANMQRRENDG